MLAHDPDGRPTNTASTPDSKAVMAVLRETAAKLRTIADEMQREGRTVADAAIAAAAVNYLAFSAKAAATCGQLNRCVAMTADQMRGQADALGKAADLMERGQYEAAQVLAKVPDGTAPVTR